VGAAAFLVAGLLIPGLDRLPDQNAPDLTAHNRDARPPRASLSPSTGPLTILVEYRSTPETAAAFMQIMLALGRIRLRDGANNWSVGQDIDDPALWIERFDVPTWNEYLRGVARGTVADQPLHEHARRFRTDSGVRRLLKRPAGSTPISEPNE
jgi:hypothetical protein